MNLIELVGDTLKPLGYKIYWQLRPKEFPSITYEFFNETGTFYGDGNEKQTEVQCQVDVWSKGDYSKIAKQVTSCMTSRGFKRTRAYDDFESATQIYHKVLIFNYYYPTGGAI